jgi:hypothetical protein
MTDEIWIGDLPEAEREAILADLAAAKQAREAEEEAARKAEEERGLPRHVMESIRTWVRGYLWLAPPMEPPIPDAEFMRELERELVPDPPLVWEAGAESVANDLLARLGDEAFAVRLLNKLLELRPWGPKAVELADILDAPGSRWKVESVEPAEDRYRVVRRSPGPVSEVLDEIRAYSEPAHTHLADAFEELTGAEPNYRRSLHEAVSAVEAAAQPIVTPNDPQATLGTIIGALNAKPSKWRVALSEERVEDFLRRAEILWETQKKHRHGSPTPAPPVTKREAAAGFYLALELVGYCVTGGIALRGDNG